MKAHTDKITYATKQVQQPYPSDQAQLREKYPRCHCTNALVCYSVLSPKPNHTTRAPPPPSSKPFHATTTPLSHQCAEKYKANVFPRITFSPARPPDFVKNSVPISSERAFGRHGKSLASGSSPTACRERIEREGGREEGGGRKSGELLLRAGGWGRGRTERICAAWTSWSGERLEDRGCSKAEVDEGCFIMRGVVQRVSRRVIMSTR